MSATYICLDCHSTCPTAPLPVCLQDNMDLTPPATLPTAAPPAPADLPAPVAPPAPAAPINPPAPVAPPAPINPPAPVAPPAQPLAQPPAAVPHVSTVASVPKKGGRKNARPALDRRNSTYQTVVRHVSESRTLKSTVS